MLICPKCRNEYRDGITHCADCKCELVSEIVQTDDVILIYGDEERLQGLKEYLEYSGLHDMTIKTEETENQLGLFVRKKDLERARKLTSVFMQQEQVREMERAQKAQEEQEKLAEDSRPRWVGIDAGTPKKEEEKAKPVQVPPTAYMNKADKASEEKSSAYALFIVGGVGIVLLILLYLDILPFNFSTSNRLMMTIVLGAMFLIFIIMGFMSLKNSKKYGAAAQSEGSLKDEMKAWLKENVDPKVMDQRLDIASSPEEEWYFKRTALLKMILNHQYMNLDQEFLDHFVDDIYDDVFPS